MKNYGLQKFKKSNVDNFTSDIGIKIRRKINPFLRPILKMATKGNIIIDSYPKLDDNKPYIFVSTHYFVEDAIANLSSIDRNAYALFGTTDQLEVNKEVYFAWLNGFIYVDRLNEESRKSALLKMERILKNGSSVLIYPEGGFNNTDNLLCLKLFASPYYLSLMTNCLVVPITPFLVDQNIYIRVGEPLDLTIYEKKEGLSILRDILATQIYEMIETYTPLTSRKALGKDPKLDYMEQRRQEYLKTNWTKDIWEEELTRYYDQDDLEFINVTNSMDDIKINKNNQEIMAPILVRRLEQKKYDFKSYMHQNWQKK